MLQRLPKRSSEHRGGVGWSVNRATLLRFTRNVQSIRERVAVHGEHSSGELIAGTFAVLILLAFVFAILRWIDSAISRRPPEQEQLQDVIAQSLQVIATPMPMPGGRWARYETKLVECEAPCEAQQPYVHDRTAPGHDPRTCADCNRKPGYSGVSFRAS